jgi:RNA polymerase subunit RPABC4/transcription elongation factor Spt4
MVLPLAVFGISNRGLDTAVKVILLFLVVIWAALIFWTYADARRRIDDPMLIACATAASLFPFVGTIVYAIVRPPEFLDDVRLRELEMHAAESRLHTLDWQLCPHCDYEVRTDYLKCPNCLRRLKEPCRNCHRPLDPSWKVCPYCEYEVVPGAPASAPPPETGSARRRRRQQQETAAMDLPIE